jgi:TonB family protein
VSALPEAMRKDFLAQLPVKEGDTISAVTGAELFAKVGGQDPRVGITAHQGVGEVEVKYFLRTNDLNAAPMPLAPMELLQIARIEAPGFDESARQRFLQTLGISIGQTMTFEEFDRKLKLARELEKGVSVAITPMANGQNSKLQQIALRIIPPPQSGRATINRIDASVLPEPLRQQVLDRFGFRVGDMVSNEQIAQKMPALHDIDRHVESVMIYTNAGSPAVEIRFYLKAESTGVSSVRATVKPIYTVPPVYPPLALQARIQGTVRFTMTVGPDGTPQRMQLVSGHPLLIPAATDAAKQYRFPPSSEEVQTAVDVTFTLNH